MPVTPQDIADSITPAEKMVKASLTGMIDAELIRQRFQGPHTFELGLNTTSLTEGVRSAIVRAYSAHWRNPRIVRDDTSGVWVFKLEALGAPAIDEGW